MDCTVVVSTCCCLITTGIFSSAIKSKTNIRSHQNSILCLITKIHNIILPKSAMKFYLKENVFHKFKKIHSQSFQS